MAIFDRIGGTIIRKRVGGQVLIFKRTFRAGKSEFYARHPKLFITYGHVLGSAGFSNIPMLDDIFG